MIYAKQFGSDCLQVYSSRLIHNMNSYLCQHVMECHASVGSSACCLACAANHQVTGFESFLNRLVILYRKDRSRCQCVFTPFLLVGRIGNNGSLVRGGKNGISILVHFYLLQANVSILTNHIDAYRASWCHRGFISVLVGNDDVRLLVGVNHFLVDVFKLALLAASRKQHEDTCQPTGGLYDG